MKALQKVLPAVGLNGLATKLFPAEVKVEVSKQAQTAVPMYPSKHISSRCIRWYILIILLFLSAFFFLFAAVRHPVSDRLTGKQNSVISLPVVPQCPLPRLFADAARGLQCLARLSTRQKAVPRLGRGWCSRATKRFVHSNRAFGHSPLLFRRVPRPLSRQVHLSPLRYHHQRHLLQPAFRRHT